MRNNVCLLFHAANHFPKKVLLNLSGSGWLVFDVNLFSIFALLSPNQRISKTGTTNFREFENRWSFPCSRDVFYPFLFCLSSWSPGITRFKPINHSRHHTSELDLVFNISSFQSVCSPSRKVNEFRISEQARLLSNVSLTSLWWIAIIETFFMGS